MEGTAADVPRARPWRRKGLNAIVCHRDQYQQALVRRMSVPISVPNESKRPLDRAAVKSEMEELRKRARAGEDLNQLQQDAYKHLHIQATQPPVNVLMLRRSELQGDEAKAFDLKPGEFSAVLDLPAAFAVIKLESMEPMPTQPVRQEIEAALRRDRMQNGVSQLTKKISAQNSSTWGCCLSRTCLV